MKRYKGFGWLLLLPLPLLASDSGPSLALLEYLADLDEANGEWTGPIDMEWLEWMAQDEETTLAQWLEQADNEAAANGRTVTQEEGQ